MRHRKKINHLGRKRGHRKAMLANMATSLIMHKRIKTTVAKAKALRTYIEPLITKSKNDSTHSRRIVFSYLQDKNAVSELFREISPKIAERPGGYTRVLKIGNRVGDSAEMCLIELVDYNENLLAAKTETTSKTGKRRRRGGKKKAEGEEQQVQGAIETTETDLDLETPDESKTIEPETSKANETQKDEITGPDQQENKTGVPSTEETRPADPVPSAESEAEKSMTKQEEMQETPRDKKPDVSENEEKEKKE